MRVALVSLEEFWISVSAIVQHFIETGHDIYVFHSKTSAILHSDYAEKVKLVLVDSIPEERLNSLFNVHAIDLIVPADHRAVEVCFLASRLAVERLLQVYIDSFGDLTNLEARNNKIALYQYINQNNLSIPVPKKKLFSSTGLQHKEVSFPVVIKLSAGYAGFGVKIVENLSQMQEICSQWESMKLYGEIFLEEYIPGPAFIHCAVAKYGKVLQSFTLQVLKRHNNTGPFCVGNLISDAHHQIISQRAELLISALNLSGFIDIDFVGEDPKLLEVNPRPTLISLCPLKNLHFGKAFLNGYSSVEKNFDMTIVSLKDIFTNDRKMLQGEYVDAPFGDLKLMHFAYTQALKDSTQLTEELKDK